MIKLSVVNIIDKDLKSFHVITKPLKTNMHNKDRKWLAEYVVQGISLIVSAIFTLIAPMDTAFHGLQSGIKIF